VKIIIERDHPPPLLRKAIAGKEAAMREAIKVMQPGESFIWKTNKLPYRAAAALGARITTRKTPNGYRVWKTGNHPTQTDP